ncbi:MAG: hypothetical protein OQK82_04235 [Candidatus Pacearchaeota archaeon]|nr:hypothetical protein [Candidatus Pacearchaeota archaeon]
MSNFQFYLEKLYASEDFQKFREENKDAYLCSCFFVKDLEKNNDKQNFDFFIPSTKKMFSFQIESNCERVPVENFGDKIPEKVDDNHSFTFEEIEKLIVEKMEKENIKSKLQRILLSLQCKNGKDFLLGTVFISSMGMIKISIDLDKMNIVDFEKKSFLDMFRVSHKNARDKD